MKKIGFIDYFIDEWHANNYPEMIRNSSLKDEFEVALAWDDITVDGKKTLPEWCQEQNVKQAESIEQVVEECDCIVVLSPDNAEEHERLADLPLRSGKPVYIDKPIAPTLAIAKGLFEKAEANNTPMMSSSALRFGSAFNNTLEEIKVKLNVEGQLINFVSTRGGGVFHIYAIHQLEMLVMALGTGAKRVMQCGNEQAQLMVIDYGDRRRGAINLAPGLGFAIDIQYGGEVETVDKMTDFFQLFVEGMLRFFKTGQSEAPKNETLEIAALIEAGNSALKTPDQWVDVPTS